MVVTAAVVEEVLYRGYAIGIGQHVWGSLAVAFVVSLFVFVVVHFSHGMIQLITVFWIALLMSLLFVLTNNLFACMLAHFVVDAVGVLLMPWVASRQRAQEYRRHEKADYPADARPLRGFAPPKSGVGPS